MATRGSRPVAVGYNETKSSDEAQMSARSGNPGLTMRPAPIGGQRPRVARTHPIADAYLLWRLFKETVHRVTGVPRDASFITTMFALGVLAGALRKVAAPLLKLARPTAPSFASTVMAGAVVREIPGGIGGVHTRGRPFAGTMIAISLVAQVLQVLRVITAPALRIPAALMAFVRRYGI
jgi:hypothetical protein